MKSLQRRFQEFRRDHPTTKNQEVKFAFKSPHGKKRKCEPASADTGDYEDAASFSRHNKYVCLTRH